MVSELAQHHDLSAAPAASELRLTDEPVAWRAWLADLVAHREVLGILARKDFQTRYKRASLGVIWAVAVPVLQGVVMAVVFSRVVKTGGGTGFGAYVMSGIVAWSYFAATLSSASTAIVDGAGLTDKVWFPRLLLVIVPGLSGLVGLVVSTIVLVLLAPVLSIDISPRLLLLLPASALLLAFTLALSMVCSALHVYFRDVKFIVQAALIVWMYVTPIVYPQELLGSLAGWIDLNPMTGVVALFHDAVGQGHGGYGRSIAVSLVSTVVLFAAGLWAQRRHDRLFVDLL